MVTPAANQQTDSPKQIFLRHRGILRIGEAFTAGVEERTIEKTTIRVYGIEKTLADCFKYRNKIGMDTALEALTLYRESRKPKPRKLLQYVSVLTTYGPLTEEFLTTFPPLTG